MRVLADTEVLTISGGIAAPVGAIGVDLNWVLPPPLLGAQSPIIDFVPPTIGGGGLGSLGPFELGGYPLTSPLQMVDASMSLQ